MYQQILLLYKIQAIDLEFEGMQQSYNQLKDTPNLKKLIGYRDLLKNSWEKTHCGLNENKKELRQAEMNLTEITQHLELIDKKIYDNKTSSKELQFLLKEKETESKNCNDLEISIIKLLEDIDEKEAIQKSQKKMLRDVSKDITDLNKEIEIEAKKIEENLISIKHSKELLIKKLESKIYKEYLSKRAKLKSKLVSTVGEDRICNGCNMKIPSQAYKKILEKKIAKCEECGRYLISIM